MKIALGIEYCGHDFYGWQAQENLPTVQGHVEEALSKIANEPIKIFCAGRTDAGVHAIGQVVHFETQAVRNERAWTIGTNTHLPPAIAVRWMQSVDESFHARFSALARRYCYVIYNSSLRPAILSNRVTWYYYPLDEKIMHASAQHLLGELDFSSFRSADCESLSPMRNMQEISVVRQGNYVLIDIQANAFLHHMVRNIVGVLLQIGSGFKKPDWIIDVLNAKDRRCAAETAPAKGLYLTKVFYPEQYAFPESTNKPLFI